jgi:exopolyphosphatase / guanosine-5'-triphosphate,3'-diphosphate pyrophosphatase
MIVAAIDIGSNAARLLIVDVSTYKNSITDFTKVNLVRVPLRLGLDVFENGTIGVDKENRLIETLKSYRHLMNAYSVTHFEVCATSALRDATNQKEILDNVFKNCGLKIQVLSGQQEADILFSAQEEMELPSKNTLLLIDVGGGSTEITIFDNKVKTFQQSFNIGTIRILKNQVEESDWDKLKSVIKFQTKNYDKIDALGTGGNINKVYSMAKAKDGKPLLFENLMYYYKTLGALTVPDRIHFHKLKEDRADVIVPALQIYTNIMKWTGTQKIYVPQIGLSDGIIKQLYKKYFINNSKNATNNLVQ